MDLAVSGADRDLDAVPVAAGGRERLRDRRLRHAVEAQHSPLARPYARATSARSGSVSSAAAQSGCSSRGGPGSTTATAVSDGKHERRSGADEPGDDRALRHGRLLAHTRSEVDVRALHPLGDGTRPGLDPALELRVDDERAPGRDARAARPCGRRGSGRGRRRRRRGRARSPSRSAASISSGTSPTIRSSAGSNPSASSERARNGPFRSVRSPRTSSDPVTTIAARSEVSRAAPRSG